MSFVCLIAWFYHKTLYVQSNICGPPSSSTFRNKLHNNTIKILIIKKLLNTNYEFRKALKLVFKPN